MKVRIDIPIDLRLNNSGTFRINQQHSDPEKEITWKTVIAIDAVSGGQLLAHLEPGYYQKTLETANGQLASSSNFELRQDGTYVDEEGHTFKITEDGNLM
jgi:hypothetical protein